MLNTLVRAAMHTCRLLPVVLVLLAGAARADEPTTADDPYVTALRLIAEGHVEEASNALARMVNDEPQHAGALLDLAILHCQLGNQQKAEELFEAVITRFAPPQPILDIITENRLRGCHGWLAKSQLSIALGRGYDGNVNQGASNPNFTLGSGVGAIDVQLLPDYLPRKDHFSTLQADYHRELSAGGSALSLQLQSRRNDSLTQFDTTTFNLGVERPWQIGGWSVTGAGAISATTLGGGLYQTQALAQAAIVPKLPAAWTLPENMQLSFLPAVAHVKYQALTNFDANTVDMRGQLFYRRAEFEVQASTGHLSDFGASERPGGNRQGWSSNVRLGARLLDSLYGELGWAQQTWKSSTVYSPGLIDTVRQQNTMLWRSALRYRLAPHQTLQLEVRHVRNNENISLFQYRSNQIQLSWQWQDF